jgi:hypothetical protein
MPKKDKNSLVNKYGGVKKLVTDVMKECLKARYDDTYLYLKCCEKLGATEADEMYSTGISIISVHKLRQVIQNKQNKLKPAAINIDVRMNADKEFKKNYNELVNLQ